MFSHRLQEKYVSQMSYNNHSEHTDWWEIGRVWDQSPPLIIHIGLYLYIPSSAKIGMLRSRKIVVFYIWKVGKLLEHFCCDKINSACHSWDFFYLSPFVKPSCQSKNQKWNSQIKAFTFDEYLKWLTTYVWLSILTSTYAVRPKILFVGYFDHLN